MIGMPTTEADPLATIPLLIEAVHPLLTGTPLVQNLVAIATIMMIRTSTPEESETRLNLAPVLPAAISVMPILNRIEPIAEIPTVASLTDTAMLLMKTGEMMMNGSSLL